MQSETRGVQSFGAKSGASAAKQFKVEAPDFLDGSGVFLVHLGLTTEKKNGDHVIYFPQTSAGDIRQKAQIPLCRHRLR